MHAMVNIAVRAARRAGDIIVRGLNRLHQVKVQSKARNDFVTDIDRRAEEAIIETIRESHPDHGILAEESGASGAQEDKVWIIDPLDGTTNFIHGFPVFAVSIAFREKGRLEHAVVYDVMSQELFTASRGTGATLEGRKIRVSNRRGVDGALIGTGFPYRDNTVHMDAYLAMFADLSRDVAGLRRPGSAALDLAHVAAGRYDGFFEFGLAPWDIAAGALLIREAGGLISGLTGEDDLFQTGHVVAGAPKVFTDLLRRLGPHVTDALREPKNTGN